MKSKLINGDRYALVATIRGEAANVIEKSLAQGGCGMHFVQKVNGQTIVESYWEEK